MGSKEMEITVYNIGIVGEPAIVPQPVTSLVGRMGPNDFHLIRPLKK